MATSAKTKIANCEVLASECAGSDSYIKQSTPMDLKKSEIAESRQYQSDAMNRERERRTTNLRRDKEIKPI